MKETRLFDVKASEEEMIIEGYAVVFEQPATYEFTEVIDSHSLDNCNMKDCVLRYNHNDGMFSMARTRNGSLELSIDEHGLKIRAKIIDTTQGRDMYKMIKEGLVDKMSFAFTVTREEWNDQTKTRRILEIDKLYDVSAVDLPYYEETEVFARTL